MNEKELLESDLINIHNDHCIKKLIGCNNKPYEEEKCKGCGIQELLSKKHRWGKFRR